MKKILTLLLAAVLMFSCLAFVACTDNKTEPTAAPTETPTEAPTDAPAEESGLDAAAEYVRQLYKDMTATGADYTVISSVKVGGVTYSVTWAVSVDSITLTATEDGKILVDLPDDGEEEIPYVLTATIADAEGNKVTKEFNLTVVFNPVEWSEYYAAETGDFIIVEGIVTGMVSKSLNGASNNCLFLQDADEKGGYYVYGMTDDPAELGIEIGMTVRVSGTKDIYSGTHEVKPNGVKIVSEEKTPVTPIDITKAYTDAENLKDKGLVDLQGALVTIKGVEITGQVESSGYYQFTLAGKESYIRISSSTCAITKAEQSTFKSTHTEKRGYLADATGIVSVYNGAIYLVPVTVDAFNNFQMVERTDAEKLVYEAGNISVDSAIHMNTTLNLPTAGGTYSDVAISWASDNACAVVDGGVVTITLQDEAQTVKLTATLTIGTETKTVEFTVAVDARPSIIPQIVDTPAADKAYKFMLTQSNLGINLFINGEMNGFYFATTSDYTEAIDVFVEVVDGGYKLYTMVGEDKTYICVSPSADGAHVNVTYDATKSTVYTWNTELKTFTTEITGTESKDGTYYMGTYGTYNTFSASLVSKADSSFVAHLVEMVDAASCVHTYAGDCDATCDLCGASREVEADHTYDNDCDAKCNVCNAERTPADHVYDNACDVNCNVCGETRKVQHADAEGDGKCDVCGVNMADTVINYGTLEAPITTTQAVQFNASLAAGDVSEEKFYVQGVITQIGSKGSYYKNVYITDGETEFLIYSINLMEDMTSMKVGDTITAHGFIKNYNGTIEMASNGSEYVYVVAFVESVCEHTYSGDCDATCDNCGATREATGTHTYDNDCDTSCNVCEAAREVTHTYDNACDTNCNVCGATRTITHNYVDGTCSVCGAAQPTVPSDSTTVTVVIGDYASANSWADKTMYNTITVGNITITANHTQVAGDYGANTGKYYDNGLNWRIYQSEAPEFVISFAEGTIVSVKVSYASQNTGTLTLNGQNIASDELVAVNASSVTFSVGNTGDATNGQACVTAIEIVVSGDVGDVGGGDNGGEDPTPEQPPVGGETLTALTELKNGDVVVIAAPAYNMALSAEKVSADSFYNKGVDISGGLSAITDAEKFTVTVNGDGSYTFTSKTGVVIAMADDYSSLNADGANKSWTLEAKDGATGVFYVKNTVRGNYLEWYASKNNWSTYSNNSDDQFEISFYAVG